MISKASIKFYQCRGGRMSADLHCPHCRWGIYLSPDTIEKVSARAVVRLARHVNLMHADKGIVDLVVRNPDILPPSR